MTGLEPATPCIRDRSATRCATSRQPKETYAHLAPFTGVFQFTGAREGLRTPTPPGRRHPVLSGTGIPVPFTRANLIIGALGEIRTLKTSRPSGPKPNVSANSTTRAKANFLKNKLVEVVTLEVTPFLPYEGSALPLGRHLENGCDGLDSNQRHLAYETSALPD